MSKKFFLPFIVLAGLVLIGAGCILSGSNPAGPVGMYRTPDKGNTWLQIVAYPTAKGVQSLSSVNVFRIYEDPSDPNTMYLGTRGQGLYYTYDNGDTWRNFPFFNGKFIYGLAVDPKDKCTIFTSDGLHIYKTVDCGRVWDLFYSEERSEQRFVSIAIDPENSQLVYGAQLNGDVIKSADGGKSWASIKRFGFILQYMTTDPTTPKRIFVASYRDGLFRSDDGGATWTEISKVFEGFSNSKEFYRLALNPAVKDSLFWISKYGVLKSDDAGFTWNEIKLIPPPGSVNIYGFAVNPKNQKEMYFTATILGDQNKPVRSTFYRTADGGASWVTKQLPTNSIPTAIRVQPVKGDILFVGFASLQEQSATSF
ncbi:MAG: hypothetical protein Q7S66_03710 [bacterium]|nr:hypothetical protein [bacterium]